MINRDSLRALIAWLARMHHHLDRRLARIVLLANPTHPLVLRCHLLVLIAWLGHMHLRMDRHLARIVLLVDFRVLLVQLAVMIVNLESTAVLQARPAATVVLRIPINPILV